MPLASKMAMPVGFMPRRVMQMDELQIQACPHDHLCECLPGQPAAARNAAQHPKQIAKPAPGAHALLWAVNRWSTLSYAQPASPAGRVPPSKPTAGSHQERMRVPVTPSCTGGGTLTSSGWSSS